MIRPHNLFIAARKREFSGSMGRHAFSYILAILIAAALVHVSHASYTIAGIRVNVTLNSNTTASVNESFEVIVSPQSVNQYLTSREALNLTLSRWQQIIGPQLERNIINPTASSYNFRLLPGPIVQQYGQNISYVVLQYIVKNVTVLNQTAPRIFEYKFDPSVFNFANGVNGQFLPANTTLTITIPQGAQIRSIYPLPDLPPYAFANGYRNVTTVSWNSGEPLSKFTLEFVIKQSIGDEVTSFFSAAYNAAGAYTYLIIAVVILAIIIYVYMKVGAPGK